MSIKIKWTEFQTKYLPDLQKQVKDISELKILVKAKCEAENLLIVDENDKEVELEFIETKAQESETKTIDSKVIEEMVAKTVKSALKTMADENKKSPAKIFQPNEEKAFKIPATVRRWGNLQAFKTDKNFTADEKAYRFGNWFFATLGSQKSIDFCSQYGIPLIKGMTEGLNTAGGYLVPPELDNTILELLLVYGAFRPNARTLPMLRDTKQFNRMTGELTAYFVGEAAAGTESNLTYDQIQLVAKKIKTTTLISQELSEDAIISVADEVANKIGRAFAYKEDICGFNGDGTSTYGGIFGVIPRLSALNGVDDGGGFVLGAGNLLSEITLANLNSCVSITPSYARMGAKWYCTPTVWDSVVSRLLYAAGGNTLTNLQGGSGQQLMGYPWVPVEVMVTADANSQVIILFGNLAQAATLGDRREVQIAYTTEGTVGSVSTFDTDQIGIKGTERFDINVHDVGTASAAGPVVGLITAAS